MSLKYYSKLVFKPADELIYNLVKSNARDALSLKDTQECVLKLYKALQQQTKQIDASLLPLVQKL